MGIIEIKKAATEVEARQGNGVLLYGRIANTNQMKAKTEPVNTVVESNDVDEVIIPAWVQPTTVVKATNRVTMEDVVKIPSFVGPRHNTIVTRTAKSNAKRKEKTLAGLIQRTVNALIG